MLCFGVGGRLVPDYGHLSADCRQYKKRIFTKVKAASCELRVLSGKVSDRMEKTYDSPRLGPETWSHLEPDTERNREFNPDFDWVDRATTADGHVHA